MVVPFFPASVTVSSICNGRRPRSSLLGEWWSRQLEGAVGLAGDWWVYRSVIVKWVAVVDAIAMVSSFGSIWLAESSVLSG